ncbi:MAG: hypothetical protein Q8891_13465 [Bacteroidota bacterium]|nr:hypothetical protein [Bacteroidota bacterium]
MRTPKISTNFVPYSDSDFQAKALFILRSMEGNPYFTNPVPPLDTISQLLSAYSEALQKAASNDKIAVSIKNQTRKALEYQLARLTLYVMYVADNDEAILLSSGYSLTKTPSPRKIEAAGNVMLRSGGNSGELFSKIKAVKGAKSYLFEITNGRATEASVWEDYNSSRCTFTFNHLTPGQLYSVRVAALGTGHQKIYSDVASQWAQ